MDKTRNFASAAQAIKGADGMYLTQTLHRLKRQSPDSTALIADGARESWAELADHAARFAGALRRLGLAAGDRVALLAPSGIPYVHYLYGTWWAGGVLNPVNTRWSAAEIGFSLIDCGTEILIVDPAFAALVPDIRKHAPDLRHVLSLGEEGAADLTPRSAWLDDAPAIPDALRAGDDLAAILYTGGTTGRPKGVMLTHRGIMTSLLATLAFPGATPGDMFLHAAPLFHIGGMGGLLFALLAGKSCVLLPAFEPAAVLAAVETHGVSDAFLVPTMLRMVIDHPAFAGHDMSSLRLVRYGAAPMDEALMDRLVAALPQACFLQAYGITELSPTCCMLGPADHGPEAFADGRGRSAGRPIAVLEVRIVDAEGNEVPRGEAGEIVARGPTVMAGYWGRPEETASAIRDGWLHTGDIGRLDAAGYVTIVDRLKDMIVSGGENVYSAEVEAALAGHPDIAMSAVIAASDETWGERVHAVVIARPGQAIDLASVQAHCRKTLAGYKIPRSMTLVDQLPLSAAGKILKSELRQRFSGWDGKSA
ncbi:acyl-CoA synthetase [Sphingomonas colocasiae]|uniref:Long-chain fatty acid--CoA ligase n=1 Tax=Sphingomonas colocasiae TaxID=1848973 RepID=A0ABS7PWX6_9SPHN|nr:long-chain fatty acid--CoA ligase [Sphingomonas colocasiae]MBY8825646.1 long-chain fatty acid--CoA ligase [Sphingomonas colocasiae]